ncbi:group I truncated hemoglobin [Neobacillus sp. K501]
MNDDKIASVVKDFFHKIHADELMSKFFKNHDQERIQHHPETFLSHGLGESKYSNEEIANAHKDMNINNEHFSSMIAHFITSLDQNGFSEEDKRKVNDVLQGYKKDVQGN